MVMQVWDQPALIEWNTCGCCSDLDEIRLKMAASLGANETFKVESRDAKEVANSITTKFGYADRTIECTGAEPSMQTAIYVSPI